MNFFLIFSSVLVNCIGYEITYTDYDSIKELIHKPDEVGLYNEITNNPDFSCSFSFEVNEGDEDTKEIKIIKLNNVDPETGENMFPAIFCEINYIKRLILNDLTLSRLPNQFEKFKELSFLNLNNNEFKEFPQVLFSLSKLKTLHLDFNKFVKIPSEIIQMNSLEILSIGYCSHLISINSNLFKLKNLNELDLSRNPLLFKNNNFIAYSIYSDDKASTKNENNDPTKFVSYKSLKKLHISSNGLSTFPRIFYNFINLEELVVSRNLFKNIPRKLIFFINLKILDISFNHIKKLTIKQNMLSNLLKLYLNHNKITKLLIPDNTLKSLETLVLSCNRFSKLDKNIFRLKQLKSLSVFGIVFTEITKFPRERDDPISLKLTLKDISVLPNIFSYNCINELTVKCKDQIDKEINIFEHVPINSKIKYLDLSKCFLTSIPHSISKLINLETFEAEFNQIITLENVFIGMTLKFLNLSFNQIISIDRSIFDIYTLERLDLSFNNIELIPSNINNTRNRNLQIDLHENPLRSGIDVDLQ
ncbi:Leucine rich repeat protein, partial [Spraguea lophii 42_110]